ncbi:hypothetical protein BRC92_04695 [Halobacteriales archaeon QS_4_69_31]|nr:MAG: hypothetical protein BRC92_04695 [Halobacteriales archaeon QS_4_69_31]
MGLDDFLLLFTLGLLGVGTLAITILAEPATFSIPTEVQELSLPVKLFAYFIQPAILLLLAVIGGLLVSSSVPFESHLVAGETVTDSVFPVFKPAVLAGVGAGFVIIVIELALGGVPESVGVVEADQPLDVLLFSLPARVLYGGITEEVLARWGVMSVVAYGLGWLFSTDGIRVSPALIWSAITISGVIFAVLHLPMVGATLSGNITVPVIAWVLTANTLAGITYGWLFWQYSLEAAMIAHASTHIAWVTLSGILSTM